ERSVLQQTAHELRVQRVTSFVGFHACKQRQSNKGKVPDQVQCFVAAEFVVKPEWAVHYAIIREDNRVFERTAADQTHPPQRFDFAFETKRACARQQATKTFLAHVHFDFLLPHQRMWEIHETLHQELVGRIDADTAAVFDNFERLQDFQVPAALAKTPNTRL